MVTQEYNQSSRQVIYLASTDAKPTDCDNGSVVIEVDTGKRFLFDKENATWRPCGLVAVMLY